MGNFYRHLPIFFWSHWLSHLLRRRILPWPLKTKVSNFSQRYYLTHLSVGTFRKNVTTYIPWSSGHTDVEANKKSIMLHFREQRGLAVRRNVRQNWGPHDRWWTHPRIGNYFQWRNSKGRKFVLALIKRDGCLDHNLRLFGGTL